MVGTQAVLDADDSSMIKGFIINKFRGDPRLFYDGYRLIADRTGWPGFGVLPYFADAWRLPAEDALDIAAGPAPASGAVKIVCLTLSRIANFDDLDPLAQESGVELIMLKPGQSIPGDARLVIIPGSKSTVADLAFLRAQGWDIDLLAHHRRGGHVLGICGGYQMLGTSIRDPAGIEGPPGETRGLGLLNVATVMTADKRLTRVTARHANSGQLVEGYEIHIGQTDGPDRARAFATVDEAPEGAMSPDGRVTGSYLHGLFAADMFRRGFLAGLGIGAGRQSYDAVVETTLDALADHLGAHLDLDGLFALAR
jgi:adenosylcobyric acid synthase